MSGINVIIKRETEDKCRFWKEGDGISVDMSILCKSVTSKWKCSVRSMEYSRTEVRDLRITNAEMKKKVGMNFKENLNLGDGVERGP